MKIILKHAVVILCLFCFYNCVGKQNKIQRENTDNCKSSQLYKFLDHYSNHSYGLQPTEEIPVDNGFYYTYFFEIDSVNYVTIWRDYYEIFSDILKAKNPDKVFNFKFLKVTFYKFIIITDQFFKHNDLLAPCNACFQDINTVHKPDDMEWDEGLHARTYKYYVKDGEYVFERLEDYNIDFLGEEWIEWEEYKMANMRRAYPDAVF